ncbi:MAG TPA: ABC transporter permease [Pseudonocardiaceae bacterium]
MSAARLFLVGGALSYRALFAWLTPGLFAATMIITPVGQILFFALLGPALTARPATFFVLGGAVQACAMAGVHGMLQGVSGERQAGTLPVLVTSPASRTALWLGRTAPHVANGVLVSVVGLAFGAAVLGVRVPTAAWLPLAVALLTSVVSCTALGLLLGAVGLVHRDTPFVANLVYLALLLVTGATVPVEQLPAALRAGAPFVPLPGGIAAVRAAAAHGATAVWRAAVLHEAAVAAVCLVAGLTSLRALEHVARRTGGLELY